MDQVQIFISYARENHQEAREIYRRLAEAGFKPWLDEEDLLPGQDFRLVIERSLTSSDFVIICLSQISVAKRSFFQREIKHALDKLQEMHPEDIFVIPARLDDCVMPEELRYRHWVNLFEERGWEKLFKALDHELRRLGKSLPPPPTPKLAFKPVRRAPRRAGKVRRKPPTLVPKGERRLIQSLLPDLTDGGRWTLENQAKGWKLRRMFDNGQSSRSYGSFLWQTWTIMKTRYQDNHRQIIDILAEYIADQQRRNNRKGFPDSDELIEKVPPTRFAILDALAAAELLVEDLAISGRLTLRIENRCTGDALAGVRQLARDFRGTKALDVRASIAARLHEELDAIMHSWDAQEAVEIPAVSVS